MNGAVRPLVGRLKRTEILEATLCRDVTHQIRGYRSPRLGAPPSRFRSKYYHHTDESIKKGVHYFVKRSICHVLFTFTLRERLLSPPPSSESICAWSVHLSNDIVVVERLRGHVVGRSRVKPQGNGSKHLSAGVLNEIIRVQVLDAPSTLCLVTRAG